MIPSVVHPTSPTFLHFQSRPLSSSPFICPRCPYLAGIVLFLLSSVVIADNDLLSLLYAMMIASASLREPAFIRTPVRRRILKADDLLMLATPPAGMYFPLSHLPLELALEIIRLAALPSLHAQTGSPLYAPACALAQVSHSVRQVTMPHFLHSVIFSSQDALDLFVRTVELQHRLAAANSRLRLDYTKYVRRIWSTRCWEPLVQQPSNQYRNYGVLYPLFSRAQTIGLNSNSMHLFHEIIGTNRASTLPPWDCKRVVLAGQELRWNSITCTAPGIHFLAQLTHLTIWFPTNDALPDSPGSRIPSWMQRVPFEYMPNLTHFAFTLVPSSPITHSILVYIIPSTLWGSQAGGNEFRKWVSSDNPLEYGFVCERYVYSWTSFDFRWESAFASGEDTIWTTKQ